MGLQEFIKSTIITAGLTFSTATVNATEQVENKVCETLELTIGEENCKEKGTCEPKKIERKDGKFKLKIEGKIYIIKTGNNGIATISDEGDVNGSDISGEIQYTNNEKGNCKIQ